MPNETPFTAQRDKLLDDRAKSARRRQRVIRGARLLGRWIPFHLRKALATKHPRFGYLLTRERELVFDRYLGEYSVHIDVFRAIEREMLSNTYERALRQSLSQWIKNGWVVVDVGANVGALSLFFAQCVGPRGKVLAFEPGLSFYERLKANLSLNPAQTANVQVYNTGLGDKEGELFWQEDPAFPGNATLTLPKGSPVPVTTLDCFQSEHSLDRCDLIKIDVEGMELEVLQGASAFVARFRPLIVFESMMEFEASRSKPIRQHTQTLLQSWNYRLVDAVTGEPVAYPQMPAMVLARPD